MEIGTRYISHAKDLMYYIEAELHQVNASFSPSFRMQPTDLSQRSIHVYTMVVLKVDVNSFGYVHECMCTTGEVEPSAHVSSNGGKT